MYTHTHIYTYRHIHTHSLGSYCALMSRQPEGVVDPSKYEYCQEYSGGEVVSESLAQNIRSCEVWDELSVQYETLNSMFVTTRASKELQYRNCTIGEACDKPFVRAENTTRTTIYVPDVETYTIGLTHNFQARRFYVDSGQTDASFSDSSFRMV